MASMSTTLVKFSQQGNTVTYTAPQHTVAKPRLLLQKRKIPSSAANAVADSTTTVLFGTTDAVSGVAMASRCAASINVRTPVNAAVADVDGMIALARDYVASDAFVNLVKSQLFVS